MDSILFHRDSAHNLIQNHIGLASSAAHKLAHSNEIFQQFGDLIVQSQLNSDCSASSFSLSRQLGNEPFQSLSSVWRKLDFCHFGIDANSFSDAESSASLVGYSLDVELARHSPKNIVYSSDRSFQSLVRSDLLLSQLFRFDPGGCYNSLIKFLFDRGKGNKLVHNRKCIDSSAAHNLAPICFGYRCGSTWIASSSNCLVQNLNHFDRSLQRLFPFDPDGCYRLLNSRWPLANEGDLRASRSQLIVGRRSNISCCKGDLHKRASSSSSSTSAYSHIVSISAKTERVLSNSAQFVGFSFIHIRVRLVCAASSISIAVIFGTKAKSACVKSSTTISKLVYLNRLTMLRMYGSYMLAMAVATAKVASATISGNEGATDSALVFINEGATASDIAFAIFAASFTLAEHLKSKIATFSYCLSISVTTSRASSISAHIVDISVFFCRQSQIGSRQKLRQTK